MPNSTTLERLTQYLKPLINIDSEELENPKPIGSISGGKLEILTQITYDETLTNPKTLRIFSFCKSSKSRSRERERNTECLNCGN